MPIFPECDCGLDGNYREVIQADRTYYVRTDGDDLNDGLSNTSEGAFATLQHGWDVISGLDMGINTITLQVGNGTFTEGLEVNKTPVGRQTINIIGDPVSPSNVIIYPSSGRAFMFTVPCKVSISGFKIVTNNSHAIFLVSRQAQVYIANIDFGACGTGVHIYTLGYLTINGNYTISGNAYYHIYSNQGGFVYSYKNTITLSGTPTFIIFNFCKFLSSEFWFNTTITGSANGKRYNSYSNSVIDTNGAGANYFPGTVAGTTGAGGIYL